MRHDPTSGGIIVILHSLKMHGMAQAVTFRFHHGGHRDVLWGRVQSTSAYLQPTDLDTFYEASSLGKKQEPSVSECCEGDPARC